MAYPYQMQDNILSTDEIINIQGCQNPTLSLFPVTPLSLSSMNPEWQVEDRHSPTGQNLLGWDLLGYHLVLDIKKVCEYEHIYVISPYFMYLVISNV